MNILLFFLKMLFDHTEGHVSLKNGKIDYAGHIEAKSILNDVYKITLNNNRIEQVD